MSKLFTKKVVTLLISILLVSSFMVGCANKDEQKEYPSKEITLIVPFDAGGGTDGIARAVASSIESELGQPIVVINKTGAGGVIGSNEIASSDPDGYTLGVFSNTDVANFVYSIKEGVEFEIEDFEYIAGLNETGNLLITPKDSDIKTLEDFVNKAKENPGAITVALPSKTQNLDVTLMENNMDIDVTGVVYDGGSKVLADLIGGHIEAGILSAKFAGQAADEGLNVLGLMLDDRLTTLPDIPTFKEQGYDVSNPASRMLIAPKGLPEDVLEKIETALDNAYASELSDKLIEMGESPVYRNTVELNSFLEDDFSMRKEILEQ